MNKLLEVNVLMSNKVQSSDRIIPSEIFKRAKERILICCKNLNIPS